MTLPQGWTNVRLADVAFSALGKMLDAAKRTRGVSLPYLRNINVRWGSIDVSDLNTMPFEPHELERYAVEPGDVLICEGGEPGRAAVWSGPAGQVKYQKALHRVRVGPSLDAQFLISRLRLDAGTGKLAEYFTGSTIKHFPGDALATYEFPLPPLPEQKRIVAKLDALLTRSRAAKESLDRLPALLDKLRQSVLAAAFRGDLTKDWRAAHPDVEPASKLLERIRVERRRKWEEDLRARGKDPRKAKYEEPAPVDAEGLPELPVGWCWASVDDLAIDGPTNGWSPSAGTDSGTRTLRLSATTGGTLRLDEQTTKGLGVELEPESPFWLRTGDLLVQRANTIDYVGTSAVFDGPSRTYCYPDLMMRIRFGQDVITRWVHVSLTSLRFRGYFRARATGTAGNMPKINGTTMRASAIPLPPVGEISVALQLIETVLGIQASLEGRVESEVTRLATLEQSLLAKAFRGELVPQDPNDEPASVLLERIRQERAAAGVVKAKRGRKAKAG